MPNTHFIKETQQNSFNPSSKT